MEDKTISESESLAIITEMIDRTKCRLHIGDGNMLLLWGYTSHHSLPGKQLAVVPYLDYRWLGIGAHLPQARKQQGCTYLHRPHLLSSVDSRWILCDFHHRCLPCPDAIRRQRLLDSHANIRTLDCGDSNSGTGIHHQGKIFSDGWKRRNCGRNNSDVLLAR